MEEVIRRLTELSARQQQFTERLAAQQEYTDRVVEQLQVSVAGRLPLPGAPVRAHQYLVRLTENDDIEAYLHTFEVIAAREGWVQEEWARIIAPFLTGEAQRAYYALRAPRNEQYDELKAEILARVGLSPMGAAQQFYQWTYDERQPVRAQAAQLARLTHLWLLAGSPTPDQVAEKVLIDRLLRALPRPLRRPVSMRNPQDVHSLWMSRAKDTNARVTRWFLALQDFCFQVQHRAGADHGNADGLSRGWSGWAGLAAPHLFISLSSSLDSSEDSAEHSRLSLLVTNYHCR
ncbi:uncharacterized protein [Sinocyclocheilus grahami]|uniref:uncharacterized protein n=1 Tax=Sinocyclocheilus grahami TaxID=75366 RepID=UPI0007AD10CD|nr:PREDICTED: uncharacterized protein LOC107595433 [Sinocyclocheilus grahami]